MEQQFHALLHAVVALLAYRQRLVTTYSSDMAETLWWLQTTHLDQWLNHYELAGPSANPASETALATADACCTTLLQVIYLLQLQCALLCKGVHHHNGRVAAILAQWSDRSGPDADGPPAASPTAIMAGSVATDTNDVFSSGSSGADHLVISGFSHSSSSPTTASTDTGNAAGSPSDPSESPHLSDVPAGPASGPRLPPQPQRQRRPGPAMTSAASLGIRAHRLHDYQLPSPPPRPIQQQQQQRSPSRPLRPAAPAARPPPPPPPPDDHVVWVDGKPVPQPSTPRARAAAAHTGRRPPFAPTVRSRLYAWLHAHAQDPYPSVAEKERLMAATNLSLPQLNNWLINARRRALPVRPRPPAASASAPKRTRRR